MADASNEITRTEALAVGATSVEVSPPRQRSVIYLRNTSTAGQVITVRFGFASAVASEGIVLSPGDMIIDSTSQGYICYQGTITAIADAAGGQLSIYERG